MNSVQFEELCRFFVAEKLGLSVEQVPWRRIPGAARPGQPHDTYQADLCWEMETPMGRYLTIADAKWRVGHKVDRDDVLLLEQFRIGIGAHKAMLISNAEFTRGVARTATRLGIAVHRLIVGPGLEDLPRTDRAAIQERLRAAASACGSGEQRRPLYTHVVICKGFDLAPVPAPAPLPARPAAGTPAAPEAPRPVAPPLPASHPRPLPVPREGAPRTSPPGSAGRPPGRGPLPPRQVRFPGLFRRPNPFGR